MKYRVVYVDRDLWEYVHIVGSLEEAYSIKQAMANDPDEEFLQIELWSKRLGGWVPLGEFIDRMRAYQKQSLVLK